MAAFTLRTPASAVQGVIDMMASEGQKLYSSATHKLEEDLYDCQPDGLYQFLATLHTRVQEYGDGTIQLAESYRFQKMPMIWPQKPSTW
jgi:hypothetical protein